MRVFAWNVNGIRSCHRNGALLPFIEAEQPDVLCLQEVRALVDQCPEEVVARGMHIAWAAAEKPGYSGVATLSKRAPDGVEVGIGVPEFDREGRVLTTRHGDVTVVNVYFPHGQRDHARLPFKTAFYRAILAYGARLRAAGEQVVICGDYNTAHREIDLRNHKGNRKTSGFTEPERALIDEYLAAGWVDAWRALNPEVEAYTWWSNRPGVRARDIGWRIDLALVDPMLWRRVRGARIHGAVMGSDHCPIELEIAD
ncbi:MAG: exodeoxyribonuclease III [Myxococcales bacterium]|nr:exodeoxyribonuclease III [Myxococcales bacterium]MCB9543001.1 exodeoxyribonuclease III [Myxococcales bacterium]MCB9551782.1 exodeoxyribonuclease III [Myxococcales bacterium]